MNLQQLQESFWRETKLSMQHSKLHVKYHLQKWKTLYTNDKQKMHCDTKNHETACNFFCGIDVTTHCNGKWQAAIDLPSFSA